MVRRLPGPTRRFVPSTLLLVLYCSVLLGLVLYPVVGEISRGDGELRLYCTGYTSTSSDEIDVQTCTLTQIPAFQGGLLEKMEFEPLTMLDQHFGPISLKKVMDLGVARHRPNDN